MLQIIFIIVLMMSDSKKYISTIFSIQYIVGSIFAILIIVFRGEIALYFSNEKLKNILIIVAFTPVMTNLISMYQNLFVSIGQAKKLQCAILSFQYLSYWQ